MSESNRASPSVSPRSAASVILVRERPGSGEVEVLLQCRHRKASFMSNAFVFPGGAADPGEDDLRLTAARELFEEAGVLLVRAPHAELEPARLLAWQHSLNAGELAFTAILAELGGSVLDLDALCYFAHWITPSAEKKRFSAQFFLARLPAGQSPSMDNKEAVDAVWVTPAEALERVAALRLPPPQIRTFLELRDLAAAGMDALFAAAAARRDHAHPILPRLAMDTSGPMLLLPWDPAYRTHGTGDALEMPAQHPLAVGPSRFVLEDTTWRLIDAPSSPVAA